VEGQSTEPLLAYDPTNESFVLGHLLAEVGINLAASQGGRHSKTSKVEFGYDPTKEVLLSMPKTHADRRMLISAVSTPRLISVATLGRLFRSHSLRAPWQGALTQLAENHSSGAVWKGRRAHHGSLNTFIAWRRVCMFSFRRM